MEKICEILQFWFGNDPEKPGSKAEQWWKKDPEFDAAIRQRFGEERRRAVEGTLETWKDSPRGTLAWIILLDQFSRNLFRDDPEAFAHDALSREACKQGMEKGFDRQLGFNERVFFYMPLMHSEDRSDHRLALEAYRHMAEEAPPELKGALENNFQYARRHAEIIERFGRYPHRNKVLGRRSTEEEIEFLKQPGSSF
jgi:uncharacterized protein (DUF924 family)